MVINQNSKPARNHGRNNLKTPREIIFRKAANVNKKMEKMFEYIEADVDEEIEKCLFRTKVGYSKKDS